MLSYENAINIIQLYRKSDSVITDIGSTKKQISSMIKKNKLLKNFFVGSHPLTGKETSSIKNSSVDIFQDSYVLISSLGKLSGKIEKKIVNFWHFLGCKTLPISPESHDKILSMTSHLPHILSFILVDMISRNKMIDNIDSYTGGGFRDLARLSKSDINMWADIIFTNKINILSTVSKFSDNLNILKKIVTKGDVESIKKYLQQRKNKSIKK